MNNSASGRTLFTGSESYYLNVVVMLVLMIFFRFIPVFGSMTEIGMAVLGVFIGTIYGWMTMKDMSLASAAGIVMMGTTGFYATPAASISAAFGHNQFISVVGCFALIAVMQHSGLIEYLVKAIVRWKVARNSIPMLLFVVTIFSHIFGFFGNFGMYALIWTLWKGIVEEIHGDKKLLEFRHCGDQHRLCAVCLRVAVHAAFACGRRPVCQCDGPAECQYACVFLLDAAGCRVDHDFVYAGR